MLKAIVNNNDINGDTSFASLMYKFNTNLLSSRVILSSECDFFTVIRDEDLSSESGDSTESSESTESKLSKKSNNFKDI